MRLCHTPSKAIRGVFHVPEKSKRVSIMLTRYLAAGGRGGCLRYVWHDERRKSYNTWNCPASNNVHTLNTPNVLLSCLWFFVCSLDYGASSSWSRKCGPAYSVVTSTCPTSFSREIKIHNTIGWIGAYTSKCGGFCCLLYGGVSPYRLVWALT